MRTQAEVNIMIHQMIKPNEKEFIIIQPDDDINFIIQPDDNINDVI